MDRVHERWVGARVRLQRRLQLPLASRFAEVAVRETTVTKVEEEEAQSTPENCPQSLPENFPFSRVKFSPLYRVAFLI